MRIDQPVFIGGFTSKQTDASVNDVVFNISSGGNVTISPDGGYVNIDGKLGILEGGTSPTYHSYFQGGDQNADLTYTLPTALPASASFLKISSSGVMTNDTSTYLTAEADTLSSVMTRGATTALQLTSTLANGTSPLAVTSSTVNTNLNADMLDGNHANAFLTSLSGALLLNQTSPQTIINGVPLLQSTRNITQNNEIVDKLYADSLAGGGMKSFFFTKHSAGIGSMYLADLVYTDHPIEYITGTAHDGETLIAEFITATTSQSYRVTEGSRFFYFTARASSASKETKLKGYVYTCDLAGGNQTLLRASSLSLPLTTLDATYFTTAWGNSLYIDSSTTRIIFKIAVVKTGTGNDPLITLSVCDDTFSRLDVPSPVGVTDLSGQLHLDQTTPQTFTGGAVTGNGLLRVTSGQLGLDTGSSVQNNYTATIPPTINDDSAEGYSIGSIWVTASTERSWRCYDVTVGAAVWKQIGSAGAVIQSFTSQTSIIIVHNFGTYPMIQVINDSGIVVIPQAITNTSLNSSTVTFSTAESGTVICIGVATFSVVDVTNIDGGTASSIYGGTVVIDCGGI